MKNSLTTFNAFKTLSSDMLVQVSDAELNEMQAMLLEMLQDIVSFCEKKGIRYSLSGGSVLGAVRHQGFIPWDDDIDINMEREEYQRFSALFPGEFSGKYWLHTPEKTDNYALLMAKVRKRGTTVKTRDDFQNEECGLCVDIFIVENTFDSKTLREVHKFGSLALGYLLSCRKFWRDREYLLPLAENNPTLKKTFQRKIRTGFFISFASVNFWTRFANRWNGMCKNTRSKNVVIPAGRKYFSGEIYRREDLCTFVNVPYETCMVNIPRGYDAYLKQLFGDYGQLPAEDQREKHSYFELNIQK